MGKSSNRKKHNATITQDIKWLANFLCTPIADDTLCSHPSHQYFEVAPERIAWCIILYEDHALAAQMLRDGKARDEITATMWELMEKEQSKDGPVCHHTMHLCKCCAYQIMTTHLPKDMVTVALLPALVTGTSLLFVTDRQTHQTGVMGGLPPCEPSQQELREALQNAEGFTIKLA